MQLNRYSVTLRGGAAVVAYGGNARRVAHVATQKGDNGIKWSKESKVAQIDNCFCKKLIRVSISFYKFSKSRNLSPVVENL